MRIALGHEDCRDRTVGFGNLLVSVLIHFSPVSRVQRAIEVSYMHEIKFMLPSPWHREVIYFEDTIRCSVFMWRWIEIHAMHGNLVVSDASKVSSKGRCAHRLETCPRTLVPNPLVRCQCRECA